MSDQLRPIEEDLWNLALACTNDASGAARVVASLARDHRDLGRVSEARLRREVLSRAELWGSRSDSVAGGAVCPSLKELEIPERAALWLDAGPGLSVAEIAWICAADAPTVRRMLDDLRSRLNGDERSIAGELQSVFEATDRTELLERLGAARDQAQRKENRRALLLMCLLGAFVVVMAVVLFDLLSWRDASETLPGRFDAPPAVDPAP